MEINKIVCLQNKQMMQLCCYCLDWNGIPVFITSDSKESRSALYKDGTSFFILSGSLIKIQNEGYLYNRLWHEVAHLYYKDVWEPWDIVSEYRADLVASAATSRNLTLSRLYALKKTTADPVSLSAIGKRIENLYSTPNAYTKASALYMLSSLKPVTVLK